MNTIDELEKLKLENIKLKKERLILDKRIRNQRLALRDNWEIVEERRNWLGSGIIKKLYIKLLKHYRRIKKMKKQPLKQGSLDGLCAAYAVFNSLKWINDHDFMNINDYDKTCEIFISCFDNILNLDVVLNGSTVETPLKLLCFMKKYSPIKYKFVQNKTKSLDYLLKFGPCVVGFSGIDYHWTVVTHSDEKYYYLFDSATYKKLHKKKVIINAENPKKFCIDSSDIISIIKSY